jgi:hypothetical protein
MMLRMIDDYERTDFHDGFVIVRSEKSASKKKSPRLARADQRSNELTPPYNSISG